MKKGKLLKPILAIIFFSFLGWFIWPAPTIEVLPLNMSPLQAGDTNASVLPIEKQNKVFTNVVMVRTQFKDKEYTKKYGEDAVTMTTSGAEFCSKVYTNDPDKKRVEQYTQ